MAVEWMPFLHRGLLIIVGLIGFQGLFREIPPVSKALSWMVFQTSLVLLWLSIAPRPAGSPAASPPLNPLAHALAFSVLLVSLGILMGLWVLAPGTPSGDREKRKPK